METEYTLEEIGQQYSVMRERIRQIEAAALRKLAHPSRSSRLRAFLVSEISRRSTAPTSIMPKLSFSDATAEENQQMSWTRDWVEHVEKLWVAGKSSDEIAKEIGGISRDEVLSVVRRLEIARRANSIS